jgi:uncharacterized membrane protein
MANSTGLKKETAGALCYVLGPVTGVLFLIIDKDPYVKFHAVQSIVVFIGLFAIQWILTLSIVLVFLVPLVGILTFVLWLLLIYKAWMGEKWAVPLVGGIVEKILKKV